MTPDWNLAAKKTCSALELYVRKQQGSRHYRLQPNMLRLGYRKKLQSQL
jgi:hypothetical protein